MLPLNSCHSSLKYFIEHAWEPSILKYRPLSRQTPTFSIERYWGSKACLSTTSKRKLTIYALLKPMNKTTLSRPYSSSNSWLDSRFIGGKPTLEYARLIPKTFASMTHEQIIQLALSENPVPEACRECVVRDIMAVDSVDYDEALKVFNDIAKTNREGMNLASLPFKIGFGSAFLGGVVSTPLVFEENTMKWFNRNFVTAELPPPEDLETWLEVGAASWSWMEPVIGQVSFFLLCMQFARAQLQNLGIRPYYNWQLARRAHHLVMKYPQYDPEFLMAYSKCDRLAAPHTLSE